MDAELFITELMFALIVMIAVLVFWQLMISKPQDRYQLIIKRTILWYFGIEIYMHSLAAVYWYTEFVSVEIFRILAYTPKVIMKLVLLYLIVKHNRKYKS